MPLEQRITQRLPQTAQCVADRGLRQVEARGSARHAALHIHPVEHQEEIEVEIDPDEWVSYAAPPQIRLLHQLQFLEPFPIPVNRC